MILGFLKVLDASGPLTLILLGFLFPRRTKIRFEQGTLPCRWSSLLLSRNGIFSYNNM
jgi:hypothetical protein